MISPHGPTARVPLAFAPMLGLVLVAANLRAAISSVPEVIVEIRAELGWNDVELGALTTIPVLCMGIFALAVPAVSNRFGRSRTVAIALGILVFALLMRLLGAVPGVLYVSAFLAGVGIALALSLLVAVPVTISGNAILQKQADQAVSQKQMELERAQAESNNPQLIEALVGQLRQAGQLDPNLSDELASGQAKRFIDGRLGQLKQQVQQAERARSLTLGQRRFSGTGVALLLALATAAVAMAAIL